MNASDKKAIISRYIPHLLQTKHELTHVILISTYEEDFIRLTSA